MICIVLFLVVNVLAKVDSKNPNHDRASQCALSLGNVFQPYKLF